MSKPTDVINLFDQRIARTLEPFKADLEAYREAHQEMVSWDHEVSVIGDQLIARFVELFRHLPVSDPELFESIKRWYLGSVGSIVNLPALPADKLVELLARGMVSMLTSMITADDLVDDISPSSTPGGAA